MLPHVVRAVVRQDGTEYRRVKPKSVRRVCSVETSRKIKNMLRAVVEQGTGKAARIQGVDVGGKTGTAQKPRPGGGYWADKHIAVFVMVLPVENPQWVIAVMADEPHNGYHGGTVAAPAARDIAVACLRLRGELAPAAEFRTSSE
jgi:cell division protein FtsI/penicillin-binding protein 2